MVDLQSKCYEQMKESKVSKITLNKFHQIHNIKKGIGTYFIVKEAVVRPRIVAKPQCLHNVNLIGTSYPCC